MVTQPWEQCRKNLHSFLVADEDSDSNLELMRCNMKFKGLKKNQKVHKMEHRSSAGTSGEKYTGNTGHVDSIGKEREN